MSTRFKFDHSLVVDYDYDTNTEYCAWLSEKFGAMGIKWIAYASVFDVHVQTIEFATAAHKMMFVMHFDQGTFFDTAEQLNEYKLKELKTRGDALDVSFFERKARLYKNV